MKTEKMTVRFGAGILIAALVLRLLSSSALAPVLETLLSPQTASVVMFMETGRLVRSPVPALADPVQPQALSEQAPQDPVAFSPKDADLVAVNSYCGYEADPQQLLQMPLDWNLTEGGPAVLIVHSHGTESYEKNEDYQETTRYRTLNTQYNVVSVGERIAQLLEDGGVEVIHDRSMHDHPSYTDAYNQSRKSVKDYLERYPSIRMVLDIHRDALQASDGTQLGYTVSVGEEEVARVMLVVGTNASGLKHPNWQQNLSLAVKLHAQLEKTTPGLCRPISFRSQRFNQDLSAGAVLVEIGAAGNTRQEALASAALVAQGILALARGTEDPVW